jgi:uncharacterized membrane protein YeaQ/YmgE (transglycosylase-associated protein family)
MHWIWLIIVGAIVGALGRLFHPGPDPMGWIVTIVLGIVSLIIGGLIAGGFWGFVIGRDRGDPHRSLRQVRGNPNGPDGLVRSRRRGACGHARIGARP